MKILFIHQNFPAQYKHIAPLLARRGHQCIALTLKVDKPTIWKGVRLVPYRLPKRTGQNVHPWLIDLDTKVTRAEACFQAARDLREQGFVPDLIMAHPGWGESLFLSDVWPTARLALYCELYHLADPQHMNFDPEFAQADPERQTLRLRLKNINSDLHFAQADAGLSPTTFQADTFPPAFRDKITVCHDGIETKIVKPNPTSTLDIPGQDTLSRDDEVISFVNRNLEPYRGYHMFMRALPELLRMRPNAQVVILGGDGVSYGSAPPKGTTWKQQFIDEVRRRISDEDWARVHFLGRLPYNKFLSLLQISRVHVYLTYPFVLSWSLLEAMACEAAIVASATAPVEEVIKDGVEGCLVDFFDTEQLLDRVNTLLEDNEKRGTLGRAARAKILRQYDLNTICLPQQIDWMSSILGGVRL